MPTPLTGDGVAPAGEHRLQSDGWRRRELRQLDPLARPPASLDRSLKELQPVPIPVHYDDATILRNRSRAEVVQDRHAVLPQPWEETMAKGKMDLSAFALRLGQGPLQ
jgi:hypothetical protein